ncbi:MAG: hypothetical protein HZB44_10330 [Actinobacteria bacterium]|nr:hypothetical protein [Actinomycetota bacterium]
MPKRVKIGDVIEIKTKKGLAYAQFTFKHDKPPRYGALIRILPGFFKKRPSSFSELVKEKERFIAFFPLAIYVNRQVVTVVGNEAVPEEWKELPLFRDGIIDPETGQVSVWWLWDGENDRKVGELTPEQKKLPVMPGTWNDIMLVHRIESGWTSESDPLYKA